MEEEQKTLEYQETMGLDVENITKNKKHMETNIHALCFEETTIFRQEFLDQCLKVPTNLRSYHLKSN